MERIQTDYTFSIILAEIQAQKQMEEEAFDFFSILLDPKKTNEEKVLKFDAFSKKEEFISLLIRTHKLESSEVESIKIKLYDNPLLLLESIFLNLALLEEGKDLPIRDLEI